MSSAAIRRDFADADRALDRERDLLMQAVRNSPCDQIDPKYGNAHSKINAFLDEKEAHVARSGRDERPIVVSDDDSDSDGSGSPRTVNGSSGDAYEARVVYEDRPKMQPAPRPEFFEPGAYRSPVENTLDWDPWEDRFEGISNRRSATLLYEDTMYGRPIRIYTGKRSAVMSTPQFHTWQEESRIDSVVTFLQNRRTTRHAAFYACCGAKQLFDLVNNGESYTSRRDIVKSAPEESLDASLRDAKGHDFDDGEPNWEVQDAIAYRVVSDLLDRDGKTSSVYIQHMNDYPIAFTAAGAILRATTNASTNEIREYLAERMETAPEVIRENYRLEVQSRSSDIVARAVAIGDYYRQLSPNINVNVRATWTDLRDLK